MRIARTVLAALAGAVVYAGFTPHRWFLAIIGIALFSWSIESQSRKFRTLNAVVFAFFFYAPLVSWVEVIGWNAEIFLTLLCVIPWLLFAFYQPHNSRSISAIRMASTVVIIEWVHSGIPWGGFPWGLLAYSQVDGPFTMLSRLGGEVLVTAIVVFAGVSLYSLIRFKEFLPVVCISTVAAGFFVVSNLANASTSSVIIAVVQGNVPRLGLSVAEQAKRVFHNHIDETRKLSNDISAGIVARPDLVVWPENAADGDPINNRSMFNEIQRVVDELNIPVLIGAAVRDGFVGPYNAGILWLPNDGPNQRYEKVHLVPFGEYIPNHSTIQNLVSRFGIAINNYVPGNRTGLITHDELKFGDVICFEVAYGDHISKSITAGAQFLTVQSNNATYALTEQPTQQLQITRFRAIEHKRSIAVATTTGISALIESDGTVITQTKEMQAAHLVGRIETNKSLQLIDRWGSGWLLLIAVLVLFLGQRKDASWKSTRALNSALVA